MNPPRHPPLGWFVALLCAFLPLLESAAAPYGPDGMEITYRQPDGKVLNLRVFGDEYYARTETLDGYTVLFDDESDSYLYARLNAAGDDLVSSGLVVGFDEPQDLALHLERKPERRREIAQASTLRAVDTGEEAAWEARIQALSTQRAAPPEGVALSAPDPSGNPISGNIVGVTLLVQFPDDPETASSDPVNFPVGQQEIDDYCNQLGYSGPGNNTGSVRDYFRDQSLDALDYTMNVAAVVTLPNPRNFYNYSDYPTNATLRDSGGGSGGAGFLVVRDAIAALGATNPIFDGLSLESGTNYVLSTNILFAGSTSGVWSEGLWPHRHVAYGATINVDVDGTNRRIYDYQITNTNTSSPVVGTFIHESGHLICGFPDLYDTNGGSEGVGRHCLMGSGNHLNGGRTPGPIGIYLKDCVGWANLTDLTAADYLLDPALASTGNLGYRIVKPGTATEFFLFENRGTGVNDPWATSSPDKGLLIWHIDETKTTNQEEDMTAALHYKVSVEQADGDFDLENDNNRGDTGDLFDNTTGPFTDATTPDAHWWDGSNSGIIAEALSAPGPNIQVQFNLPNTLTVLTPNGGEEIISVGSFEITWTSGVAGNVDIALHKGGAPHTSLATNETNDGSYTWNLGGAFPFGTDYTLVVSSTSSPAISDTSDADFAIVSERFVAGGVIPAGYSQSAGSTRGWIVASDQAFEGSYSLKNDDIADSETASVEFAGAFLAGNVTFQSRVSTESADSLLFFIDDVEQLDQSGTAGWTAQSFAVTEGEHILRWEYAKDAATSEGEDTVWIDDVVLPPAGTGSGQIAVEEPEFGGAMVEGASTLYLHASVVGTPVTRILTIRNHSIATDLGSLGATFSGPDAARFSIGALGSATVAPGATTTLEVTYTPTGSGESVATLEIQSDDVETPTFQIPLSGGLRTTQLQDTFETGLGSWDDSAGLDFTMIRRTGSTGSSSTGPTAAQEGSYYLYTEASGSNNPTKEAAVETVVDLSDRTHTALYFLYHMYGVTTGTLQVDVHDGTSWTDAVWSRTGQQHEESDETWSLGTVDLSAFDGLPDVTLRIRGTTGSSFTGDMAFDAVTLISRSQPEPDLLDRGTTYHSLAPASVNPGGTITIEGDILNGGSLASGAFDVALYASTDTTISASDVLLGTVSFGPLGIGATAPLDSAITLPGGLEAGTYYLGWIIDSNGAVAEANEANNTVLLDGGLTQLTVKAPSLVVEEPVLGGNLVTAESILYLEGLLPGTPVAKTLTLRNSGTDTISAISATIAGSGAARFTAGVPAATSLAPGETTTLEVTFTPVDADEALATLTIESSDAAPFQIPLSGAPRMAILTTDFESGLGVWTDTPPLDFTLTRQTGGTPSGSTGPAAAQEGAYYIYAEASSPNFPSKQAGIETVVDLTDRTGTALVFLYHMFGAGMGTLQIDVHDGTAWTDAVWSKTGQQHETSGATWSLATFDLSAFDGLPAVTLRMRGTTGLDYTGDLAFDAISLSSKLPPTPELQDRGTSFHSLSPTTEAPGSLVTIEGDVTNSGTLGSASFTVAFYASADTTITTADTLLGTRTISPLAIDAIAALDTVVTIPADLAVGTYSIGWILDSGDAVDELDETNNTVLLGGGTPLLTVASAVLAVEEPVHGGALISGESILYLDDPSAGPTTRTLTLRNTSAVTLTGMGTSVTGPDAGRVTVGSPGATSLAGGATTTLDVTFDWSGAGEESATLLITSNAGTFSIPLSSGGRDPVQEDDFETGLGNWTDTTGLDFLWTRQGGATTSQNTGPEAAQSGGFYLYTESSSPNFPTLQAAVETTLDLTHEERTALTFLYHMYGATMGTLQVDVHDGTSWTEAVWTKTGQQHGSEAATWSLATVDLSAYDGLANVTVRLRGTTGTSFTGDMAVDAVEVRAFRVPLPDLVDRGSAHHSLSSTTVGTGDSVVIEGDVANVGQLVSGAFTVTFYASTDAQITPADTPLGTLSIAAIAPGDFAALDTTLVLPPGLPEGTYSLGWILDSAGEVAEEVESNNTVVLAGGTVQLAVVAPTLEVEETRLGADMVAGESHLYLDARFAGTPVARTLTIRNASTVATVRDLALSLSGAEAARFTTGVPAATTLAPGASTTVDVTFTPTGTNEALATLAIESSNGASFEVPLSGAFRLDFPTAGFERDLDGWLDSAGFDFNLTRGSGATPTPNTGPDSALEGSSYLYTEASPVPSMQAAVETTLDLTDRSETALSFLYHMYGASTGEIALDVHDGTVWQVDRWAKAGQQQDSETDTWSLGTVDLSAFDGLSSVTLRFRFTTGPSDTSDMAIDAIALSAKVPPSAELRDAGITHQGLSSTTARQGGVLEIRGEVFNAGTLASAPFEVTFYASTDEEITPADTPLGTATIGGIAAGASGVIDTTVTLPRGIALGEYRIGWIIDSAETEAEPIETNNAVLLDDGNTTVTLLPSALAVEEPTVGGNMVSTESTLYLDAVAVGTPVTGTLTLRNTTSGTTIGGLALSLSGPGAAGFSHTALPVTSLAPGATTTVDIIYTPAAWPEAHASLRIESDSSPIPFDLPLSGGFRETVQWDDFEGADWGTWVNSPGTDTPFLHSSTQTVHPQTGPAVPQEGSGYLVTPLAVAGNEAAIESPIALTGRREAALTFLYQMHGEAMGSLQVDIFDGTIWWQNLWTKAGQRHGSGTDTWSFATVDLSAFDGLPSITVRIRSTAGGSTSHVALDAIRVAASTPLPDLRDRGIIDHELSSSSALHGESITIRGDVLNAGNLASGSFGISFYASDDDSITADDFLLGTTTVGGLAAGAHAPIDTAVSLSALLPAGVYRIGWILDRGEAVAESEEGNNAVLLDSGLTLLTLGGGLDDDFDNDGLPNIWEQDNGLSWSDDGTTEFKNGPLGDPEKDLLTNMEEYLWNTDPNTTTAHRSFLEMERFANGENKLTFPAYPDRVYRVYRSDDLAPGGWVPIGTDIEVVSDTPEHSLTDSPPEGQGRRFYKYEVRLP